MASPPRVNFWNFPATRSVRTAAPCLAAAAFTFVSFAPVTVLSMLRTTWLDAGSTAQAVPGTVASRLSAAMTSPRSAPLRATVCGTAPAARTDCAACAVVTVTTSLPPLT
jgi:hypothetical protein